MADKKELARDRTTTRFIHALFWRAILSDKKNFALSLFNLPGFFFTHAYIPLQVAYVVQAIFKRQFDEISTYVWHIIGATIITIILTYYANRADCRMGVNGALYVQRAAFSNFLNKDYDFYSSQFVGSIGNQVAQLRQAFTIYAHEFKFVFQKDATSILSLLAVLAYFSWQLFMISLISMLVVLGYTIASSQSRSKYRRASSEASSDLSGVEADALSHGAAVKAFASSDYELGYIKPAAQKWRGAQLKAWYSLDPANTIRLILSYGVICVLLLATAALYQNNSITVAIVVLVQLYMLRLIFVTVELADLIKQYEQIMGMAYQPALTMQIQPTIVDSDNPKSLPAEPKTISFDKVNFGYHDKQKAISSFSLDIKKGERVGLVGFSGAGKTTLTKLILRFMDINKGSIKVGGVDIRQVRQAELRRAIAYVPQEPLLFHRTIKENIAYGRPEASDDEILRAAKQAYVDDFAAELPKGYDTLVGERGVKLSGGQRQRVAIARAILKDAPILVLDEATSALDSRSEKYIQTALWKLMKGRTALVIAHRLSTVQRMDKIVVMDKGRIVQTGSHQELLDKPGIYADLWAHQSGGYIGAKTEEE